MGPRSRTVIKLTVVAAFLYGVFSLIGGILLAELQLHPPRRPIRNVPEVARVVRERYHADLQNVSVTASDEAVLRGWYIAPPNDNGSVIFLLHGVGDNREGMIPFARMLLDRGYRVLLPDARAHGESGGSLATFGIKESGDISRWIDWTEANHPRCVYGLGESMGAAQLLESLAHENRFCAVAAEASFARFDEVAPERVANYTRMPMWFGKTFERLPIAVAIAYSRWRYGIEFRVANPADAVAHSSVPVLLIAGTRDRDILPHHSEELARTDPHAQLWMVNGAVHTGAWNVDRERFENTVTEFFAQHH